jgi:hypothetical protein
LTLMAQPDYRVRTGWFPETVAGIRAPEGRPGTRLAAMPQGFLWEIGRRPDGRPGMSLLSLRDRLAPVGSGDSGQMVPSVI